MSASLRRSRRSRSATITRRRSGEHLARNGWSCPLSASTALMAVHPAAACCAIGTVLSIGQPVRAHQWTCSRRRLACARRDRWIRRWHPMRWQLVCCSSRDESLLISNPHDVDYTIGTIDRMIMVSIQSTGSRGGRHFHVTVLITMPGCHNAALAA